MQPFLLIKSLFGIAFEMLKSAFNIQKVHSKKKGSCLVKKLKAFFMISKAKKLSKNTFGKSL
jgi:hypothetical protein